MSNSSSTRPFPSARSAPQVGKKRGANNTTQFQKLCGLANQVREVARAATRITEKFAVLAVQPEPGKSPDSYLIPPAVMQAISRCNICSPRYFEKRGKEAECQVERDLKVVAAFITKALGNEPSLFKTTGRDKIAGAVDTAHLLCDILRKQQLPEPGTLQAFVAELAPNSIHPVDLVVTTHCRVSGVGPIEAILAALSGNQEALGLMTRSQLRHMEQPSSEEAPQHILIPVLIKGSERETMARVSIMIAPSLFGGTEQVLSSVAEFLRDSVGKVEARQFKQLPEAELFGWQTMPTQGVCVVIVTDHAVAQDSEAKELVRETGKMLERMLKLERAFDKMPMGAQTYAGQHA